MKNPIPYTKEDIYMIFEMAFDLDMSTDCLSNKERNDYKKFLDGLVMSLTPEERNDDEAVKYYMLNIYKGGE